MCARPRVKRNEEAEKGNGERYQTALARARPVTERTYLRAFHLTRELPNKRIDFSKFFEGNSESAAIQTSIDL